MGQRVSSEKSAADTLRQGDATASGTGVSLHTQAAQTFANSPRQSAQRQAHDSIHNAPQQVMQRQQLYALQHAHPAPTAADSAVIQRVIKGNQKFPNGELDIDMVPGRRMSNNDAFGEEGLITFTPAVDGSKADDIDLVQTVESKRSGLNTVCDGEDAVREAWKADGRFVDRSGAGADIRRGAAPGRPVPAAYNAGNRLHGEKNYAGAERHRPSPGAPFREVDITPGYNNAKGIKAAELRDHPSSIWPTSYVFETEVVARKNGSALATWGSVRWAFSTKQTLGEGSVEPTWSITEETPNFHAEPDHDAAAHHRYTVRATNRFEHFEHAFACDARRRMNGQWNHALTAAYSTLVKSDPRIHVRRCQPGHDVFRDNLEPSISQCWAQGDFLA